MKNFLFILILAVLFVLTVMPLSQSDVMVVTMNGDYAVVNYIDGCRKLYSMVPLNVGYEYRITQLGRVLLFARQLTLPPP